MCICVQDEFFQLYSFECLILHSWKIYFETWSTVSGSSKRVRAKLQEKKVNQISLTQSLPNDSLKVSLDRRKVHVPCCLKPLWNWFVLVPGELESLITIWWKVKVFSWWCINVHQFLKWILTKYQRLILTCQAKYQQLLQRRVLAVLERGRGWLGCTQSCQLLPG